MPSTQTLFDLLLPSLESIGLWSYWLIGLAALLEAFFLTGIVLPGSVVVILGGALVQRGDLDFGDLIWFVAAGSWIGAGISFILGDLQGKRRAARQDMPKPEAFGFAARFFRRQGGRRKHDGQRQFVLRNSCGVFKHNRRPELFLRNICRLLQQNRQ